MPYLECPGCRLSLYSAASHSWLDDDCPVCGASLRDAVKRFPSANGARTLCRELPSTPAAVENARRALDGFRSELGEPAHSTAVLLLGELVSNSVRHSAVTNGTIEVLVCLTSRAIRVEVSDDGEGFDPPPLVHEEDEAGRGLHLVQEMADRWGWPTGLRSSVWFELDRAATAATPLRAAG
jgi:anti-sigma regulatory factor (Ser/Thr protein kinase)